MWVIAGLAVLIVGGAVLHVLLDEIPSVQSEPCQCADCTGRPGFIASLHIPAAPCQCRSCTGQPGLIAGLRERRNAK